MTQIYDVNRTRLRTFSSYSFRPPVIVTLGNELTMRFYANGGRAPGFKATYSFINGNHLPSGHRKRATINLSDLWSGLRIRTDAGSAVHRMRRLRRRFGWRHYHGQHVLSDFS